MRVNLATRVLFIGMAAVLMSACGTTFTLPRTNNRGFGDRQNDYAWGMTWFNGNLYVGTSRNEMCVEKLTTQYYERFTNPNAQHYSTAPAPGVVCPADVNALYETLRAEVWRYDPSQSNSNVPQSGWTRVYQSPAVQNPDAPADPSKTIGRDIGFRSAAVVTIDNTSTMLLSGVTAGEFLRNPDGSPRVPAPRLLATTDGVAFREYVYPGQIDISSWQLQPPLPRILYPMGFRSVVQVGTRIFVLASDSLTGDGVVMEFDPSGGTFRQVSALRVFEIAVFNNHLYVGTADPSDGYGVYRSDLSTTGPQGHYTFTPVVTGGAGRGGFVASVIAMHPFKGRLYVGSCGWYNGGGCELIRMNPDDSWDLVVGAGRLYDGALKAPLSGRNDGFDNFFNVHFWRIGDHNGALYVGSNDASWLFQSYPILGPLLNYQYGFDVFGSCDGVQWYDITNNAFLDDSRFNFGARNFAHSANPDLAFVGSANHASGTSVFQMANSTFCSTTAPSGTNSTLTRAGSLAAPVASTPVNPAAVPPARLEVDEQSCATAVSWEPVAGAARYDVFRATFQQTTSRIQRPGSQVSDALRPTLLSQFAGRTEVPQGTWIRGEYTRLGSSKEPHLLDRSAPAGAGRHSYVVVAVDGKGQSSVHSNSASTSARTPKVNVELLHEHLDDRTRSGKVSSAAAAKLRPLMNQLRTAAAHRDQARALKALSGLVEHVVQTPGIDPLTAEDLEMQISKLTRRVRLATIDCTGGADIGWGKGQ